MNSLNLTIVDCKYCKKLTIIIMKVSLNLTIVDCK